MERVTGIEPVSTPWQGVVLPMYYTRKEQKNCLAQGTKKQPARQVMLWRQSQKLGFLSTPEQAALFIRYAWIYYPSCAGFVQW